MFPSYCEHTGAGGDLLLTSSNVNIVQQFCVLCRTDPTRGLRALLVTSSAACCQLPSGRVAVTIYVTPATHTSQCNTSIPYLTCHNICKTCIPYLTIYITPLVVLHHQFKPPTPDLTVPTLHQLTGLYKMYTLSDFRRNNFCYYNVFF